MRATILDNGRLQTVHLPDPSPGKGQVLVRPLVCGICGSDLHAKAHIHDVAQAMGLAGFRGFMDPARPAVLGHEFVCEVIDHGPECVGTLARGRRVTALPFMAGPDGIELVGYSNRFNGALAEAMLLDEAALLPVPDNVSDDIAALTEPLAVAIHAVNAANPSGECAFAVHGCGPVGLFIIARLRFLGLGPIMAIDPNPDRRAVAARLGADLVIAPDPEAQARWWSGRGVQLGMSDAPGTGCRPVAFECVGKPGMLHGVAAASPMRTAIIVVGVCMEKDTITSSYLLMKEMALRFVFAYDPAEFQQAMDMIKTAPEALAAFVTSHATQGDVNDVFDRLTRGTADIKVLIRPQETG